MQEPCPETQASFPNYITYWWMNSTMLKGYKRTLTEDDLWDLNPSYKTETSGPMFVKAWNKELAIYK